MGKLRKKTAAWKKLLFVLIATGTFLLPVSVADANSIAPPSVVWFTFDYQAAPTPRLQGVQLLACTSTGCEQPVLLQQFGTCDRAGCVASAPKLTGWPNDFGCTANVCRSAAYSAHGGTDFKLVAQFSDLVRLSEVTGKLPARYDEVSSWLVTVQETSLSIQSAALPAVSNPNRSYPSQPLLLFGLSILVELIVAGLCFWRTVKPGRFEGSLLIVLLVNLVSLPVVWFFFPALGQFHSQSNLNLGLLILFLAFVYSALLAAIYRSGKMTRTWVIILTLVSLPVAAFFLLITPSFLTGYIDRYIFPQGLPAVWVIIVSEIFAVVFEALMITILSERSMSLRVTWLTSLLMNAASFTLGLVFVGVLGPYNIRTLVPPLPPTPPGLQTTSSMAANDIWTGLGPEGGIILALAIDPLTPSTLYAGMAGADVFKSTDGGWSWERVNTGMIDTSVFALAIDPTASSTLYAGTPVGIFKSTDGGANWGAANTGLTIADVFTIAIDPSAPASLYAGTSNGLFKSMDGGGSWEAVGTGPDKPGGVYSLAIDPLAPAVLYVGAVGGVFKSTDGGRTIKIAGLGYVYALAVDPTSPSTIYAGTSTGVFKSTDGAVSWTGYNNPLSQAAVLALAIDPSASATLYTGTDGSGVFISTDGGGNWEALSTGLTTTKVCSLAISQAMPFTLYAGTYGGGVFSIPLVK